MQLVVADNGTGIAQQKSGLKSGHGVANIKERSRMLGARVSWLTGKQHRETTFVLEMVLPDEQA